MPATPSQPESQDPAAAPIRRQPLTHQVSMLLVARMASTAVRFFLPILLVRIFSRSEYGLYRQLVLMESFAVVLATGLEASFFYFVPQFPERRRQLVFQTMAINGGVGLIFLLVVTIGREPIAALMNNPRLAAYLPVAGLLVFFALASDFFGDLLISEGRARQAALLAGGLDFARAAMVALAAVVTRNVGWMMIAWAAVTATRPVMLLAYVGLRPPAGAPRFSRRVLWEQIQYGIPLGLSSTASRIRGQIVGVLVSNLFTPADYAAYSIGASRVPFASQIFTTFSDVIAPRMTEYRAQGRIPEMLSLWHKALARLALVVFPMIGVSTFLAGPIISVLYTADYLDSVPVFMIFNLNLLVGMAPYGSIVKAFGETRFIFLSNLLSTALLAALGYPVVSLLGPPGAAGLMAGALILNMALQMAKIRSLLGVTWPQYLPWSALGKTVLMAALPGVVVLAMQSRLPVNLWALLALLATYVGLYLALLHFTGMLELSREAVRTGVKRVLGRRERRRTATVAGHPAKGI